jgi:hypothetical protein
MCECRMLYEPNPKHKEPWQRGRKGSICPKLRNPDAQALLDGSLSAGDKRYATHDGRAFCAQAHAEGRWHGYPVGWKEVPEAVRRQFLASGQVKRSDIRNSWEGHS